MSKILMKMKDMDEEERKKYFEELGVNPKKVDEKEKQVEGIEIVEEGGSDEKKERKEKELEQYREVSTF